MPEISQQPCARCGQPTSDDARITVGISRRDGKIFQHRSCYQEEQAERRRRCLGWECNATFVIGDAAGRPREYCSDGCRKRTAAAIREAVTAVARNRVPGKFADVEALASKVLFLRCCWAGKRAAVEHGRRFPVEPQPRPELLVAALEFSRQLAEAVETHRVQERNSQWRREAERAEQAHQRRVAMLVEADASWRKEVIAGVDA